MRTQKDNYHDKSGHNDNGLSVKTSLRRGFLRPKFEVGGLITVFDSVNEANGGFNQLTAGPHIPLSTAHSATAKPGVRVCIAWTN